MPGSNENGRAEALPFGLNTQPWLPDRDPSKAEGGAEGDAEVVVGGSVVEPDLVAGFDAQAEGAGEKLDAAAGIGCEVRRASVVELAERVGEGSSGGGVVAVAVLDEAALSGDEGAEGAGGPNLELGAEEAGERAQLAGDGGAGGGGSVDGGDGGGVVALEVVVHLRFQLDVRADAETEAAAEAYVVDGGRAGRSDTEQIAVGTEFDVVERVGRVGPSLGEQRRRECECAGEADACE